MDFTAGASGRVAAGAPGASTGLEVGDTSPESTGCSEPGEMVGDVEAGAMTWG
jgi:hypothetical protein